MADEAESAASAERHAHRETLRAGVEQARNLARQTQNPVFAWHAVMLLGWIRQDVFMHGGERGDLVIPDWCADYFASLAQDLTFLADGYDIRRDAEEDAKLYTRTVDPVTQHETWSAPDFPPLSPDESADLVNLALGFTRKGFNAFAAFRAAQDQMGMFRRFEELRQSGMRYSDALQILAQESGSKEESVLRRRVAFGRRLVKGDRPEEDDATGKT